MTFLGLLLGIALASSVLGAEQQEFRQAVFFGGDDATYTTMTNRVRITHSWQLELNPKSTSAHEVAPGSIGVLLTTSSSFPQTGKNTLCGMIDTISDNLSFDGLLWMVTGSGNPYSFGYVRDDANVGIQNLNGPDMTRWAVVYSNITNEFTHQLSMQLQSVAPTDAVNGYGVTGGYYDQFDDDQYFYVHVVGACECAVGTEQHVYNLELTYDDSVPAGPVSDADADANDGNDSDSDAGSSQGNGPLVFISLMLLMCLTAVFCFFGTVYINRRTEQQQREQYSGMLFQKPGLGATAPTGVGYGASSSFGGSRSGAGSGAGSGFGASSGAPQVGGVGYGGKTVETAVEDLLKVMSMTELCRYIKTLCENGLTETALALAVKLEFYARTEGTANDYAEATAVLGVVLEANQETEAAHEVKEVRRRTLAGAKPPKKGLSGPGMNSVRASMAGIWNKPLQKTRRNSGAGRKSSSNGKRRRSRSRSPSGGPGRKGGKKGGVKEHDQALYDAETVQLIASGRYSIADAISLAPPRR